MAYWGNSDPTWLSLSPAQKAAAMALLEADRANPNDATNVLGAMINRAEREGVDLGQSVSGRIYQPTIEPAQQARLPDILKHPAFGSLVSLAERRQKGEVDDWVGGATHFLAPEKTMLALEAKEPSKYRSWRSWTGYDPDTGSYRGVVMRDGSHAFLTPGEESKSVASAPPSLEPMQTATAPAEKDDKMNLFSMLSAFGAGAKTGSLPSAADPTTELFGNLAAFGGGGKGSSGASQDGDLAMQAMKQAQGPEEQGQQMVRKPFDMAQLQAILQRAGRLGTLPRAGGGGMA